MNCGRGIRAYVEMLPAAWGHQQSLLLQSCWCPRLWGNGVGLPIQPDGHHAAAVVEAVEEITASGGDGVTAHIHGGLLVGTGGSQRAPVGVIAGHSPSRSRPERVARVGDGRPAETPLHSMPYSLHARRLGTGDRG